MRGLSGGIVLVVGIGTLGLWNITDTAKDIETRIAGDATQIVSSTVHNITALVKGRDIYLEGYADNQKEHDGIVASADTIDGRRIIRDQIQILPVATPFHITATKTPEGISISGHVPSEAIRATLKDHMEDGANDLVLSSGAPDARWVEAVIAGFNGLKQLNSGEVKISDRYLELNGIAQTQKEADAATGFLDRLPEGYSGRQKFTIVDDGKPPAIIVSWDANIGLHVRGKAPKGLTPQMVADALGVTSVSGKFTQSQDGNGDKILEQLGAVAGYLTEIDQFSFESGTSHSDLLYQFARGVDAELVHAALHETSPSLALSILEEPASKSKEGSERIHPATGKKQKLNAGYWLQTHAFEVNRKNCAAKTDQALLAGLVNFLSGSHRLDAKSIRTINTISAIALHCTVKAGLSLEIGGHTDNTGDADANLDLSKQRASAVLSAMTDRGVEAGLITARGFGDTQPVADNTTQQGRALNRRTTINWQNATKTISTAN